MESKLWGGRFSETKMDPLVMEFTTSINIDKILAKYDCLSSKIHVQMLSKCGFVTTEEQSKICSTIDEFLEDFNNNKIDLEKFEDIHSAVQSYVEEKLPVSGKKMHTARSRNEQIVNDVRLYCKDSLVTIREQLIGLKKELLVLAERSIDIIIPGYTHLNRAQPILFSHLIMAYIEMLNRDYIRLGEILDRCDISVMGSGALAGSALDLDREFVSKKLGFKTISSNSLDAVSDRDFIAEVISGIVFIAIHFSRIAEDFILYSIQEFGFLEIGQSYCTGSSLMPQKKNPDVLELIRGKTSSIISALNNIFILLKGLPHTYNRDLQEDKKPLIESIETISMEIEIMTKLVSSIKIKERITCNIFKNDDFIYSTDLAEYLVKKNVPFKQAHDIVGSIVKFCIENSKKISELTLIEIKEFSDKIEKDIFDLLKPDISVKNKKTYGSTNPEQVKEQIKKWKNRLRG